MSSRRSFIAKALAAASLPFLTKIEAHAAEVAPQLDSAQSPHPEATKTANSNNDEAIPSYYDSYLQQRIKDVHDLIASNSPYSDTFFFFTDTHVLSNHLMAGKLIGYLMRRTLVNKVFFGGDVDSAFGGKEDVDKAIQRQTENYYPFIKPYGVLYNVKGNHDFTINKDRSNATQSWTYSSQSARNIIMGRSSIDNLITNEDDPEACYYYVDNRQQKMRYIVLDSCDAAKEGDVAWGVQQHFSKMQARWIAGKAVMTTPKDYGIVMMTHIPPIASDHIYDKDLCTFVTAIANKQKVHVYDTNFDFTACQGEVLFFLSGHMHEDMQIYHNGLLHLTTCCDAHYQDYRYSPFFDIPNIPVKTRGTIYEQTFDIINIDRAAGRIDMLRIGGGFDRHFHLGKTTISIGESLMLKVTFLKVIAGWTSSNAQGYWKNKDNTWNIPNTIVSVDSEGRVTGHEKGQAIVFAEDSSHNKEFFYVQVK